MGPGHSGIVGDELADLQAMTMGMTLNLPGVARPAGIRQHFRLTHQVKHIRELHKIGHSQNTECPCPDKTPQNAAHIRQCKEIGDGKGRTMEEAEEDPEWCEAVYEWLRKNTE